jgi:hypothetical protein
VVVERFCSCGVCCDSCQRLWVIGVVSCMGWDGGNEKGICVKGMLLVSKGEV